MRFHWIKFTTTCRVLITVAVVQLVFVIYFKTTVPLSCPDVIQNDRQNTMVHEQRQEYSDRLLRSIERNAKEIGYFVNSQLDEMKPYVKQETKEIFNEQKRLLLTRINTLRSITADKRNRKSQKLLVELEKRIQTSQNPLKCEKILRCVLPGSGLGSQMHQLVHCFLAAFGTGRVLVLEKGATMITYGTLVESVFKPLSENCRDRPSPNAVIWNGNTDQNEDVVMVTFGSIASNRGMFAPPIIPLEMKDELVKLMGEPEAWFAGAFVKYAMRLQPDIQEKIDKATSEMDLAPPLVGIHIRRTDKLLWEAQHHSVEEYMRHVVEYYDVKNLETNEEPKERKVYVASDDLTTVTELKNKYPNYKFISGQSASSRNHEGLVGVVTDVLILSKCDYLVCTFSSNVCRLSYELMHTHTADASVKFHSLDDIYYYLAPRYQVAVLPHTAGNSKEIDIEVGDVIGVRGNHWDGFSLGLNRRTSKVGLYPSFKATFKVNTGHFLDYQL
uniref:alpha-(1,6)-fucosyltransferase-like isoform X1 n=2 Tax=Ciona intestinalis TaxID=7719 RepID=UPI00089DBA9C|nr:alpha-(1,6)-fucosyltransferase-like isoform X1 [Ciona intestinalis]|eukprot:XP_002123485.3 alpha-(1,6)-fucosyltransferase-like isoform X1 [Ciona intestinalis]